MSRAYTAEEARRHFLEQVKIIAEYWASLPGRSDADRCDGVAFSILNILDGTGALPAFDIAPAPHPDDKAYHIENGDNYYEAGEVINDCMLHEEYCRLK